MGYLWLWDIMFWIISQCIHHKGVYFVSWIVLTVVGLYFSPIKFVDASYCRISFPLGVLYSLFEDDFKVDGKWRKVILLILLSTGLFFSVGMFRYSYLIAILQQIH